MAHLTISETDRLQLIGLLSVGAQLLHQLNTVDQAMCKLLDVQPDHSGYSGHISDTLYEADTHNPVNLATGLLHRLHIEVVPAPDTSAPAERSEASRVEPLPNASPSPPIGFKPSPPKEEPPF
jgi:hypothetical protein